MVDGKQGLAAQAEAAVAALRKREEDLGRREQVYGIVEEGLYRALSGLPGAPSHSEGEPFGQYVDRVFHTLGYPIPSDILRAPTYNSYIDRIARTAARLPNFQSPVLRQGDSAAKKFARWASALYDAGGEKAVKKAGIVKGELPQEAYSRIAGNHPNLKAHIRVRRRTISSILLGNRREYFVPKELDEQLREEWGLESEPPGYLRGIGRAIKEKIWPQEQK